MAVAQVVRHLTSFPGHSLTGPSTGGRLGRVGINGAVIHWAIRQQDDKTIEASLLRVVRRPRTTSLYSVDPTQGPKP